MPSRKSLLYRRNKIVYGFKPQLIYYQVKPEEEEQVSDYDSVYSEEVIKELTPEPTQYDMFIEELDKITVRSKRKLELWTRKNKFEINKLLDTDRTKLLDFIETKYFTRKR